MKIILTGGAGYIGSHTVIELLNSGYIPVIYDNFSTSSKLILKRLEKITGEEILYVEGDVLDKETLHQTFKDHTPDAIIHFAGLKSLHESLSIPLQYYQTNITGTLNLLEVMKEFKVKNFIFSSSASVYGVPQSVPVAEEAPTGAVTNPYARSKYIVEEICKDAAQADDELNVSLLRYFNPTGAHPSGLIGEDPTGIPNNLIPYVTQTAIGLRKEVSIFGNDYDTKDGTGIRDYIHVTDLAQGHIAALNGLQAKGGLNIYNLGTGTGYSVLDVINAFSKASGHKIPYKVSPRRDGDVGSCWSNPSKAEKELNWKAQKTLEDMARDSWNWQKNNPNGYEEASL